MHQETVSHKQLRKDPDQAFKAKTDPDRVPEPDPGF
jgi:hypothetical protein